MKISATISLDVPCEATDDQIDEWLEFELGVRGSMSMDNPLSGFSLDCESVLVD